jgi:hypothetical protein
MKNKFLAFTTILATSLTFGCLAGSVSAQSPMATQKPITTPSGLQYVDLKVGTGASPRQGDQVTVNYTGWQAIRQLCRQSSLFFSAWYG